MRITENEKIRVKCCCSFLKVVQVGGTFLVFTEVKFEESEKIMNISEKQSFLNDLFISPFAKRIKAFEMLHF